MEKSLNSLIQKHRFEAPVLVTIQVCAHMTQGSKYSIFLPCKTLFLNIIGTG